MKFQTVKNIYYGCGSLAKLPEIASGLSVKSIMIITDKGVRCTGIVDPIANELKKVGFAVEIYDAVKSEPTVNDINSIVGNVGLHWDLLVGIGGGSTLDSMKALSLLISNQCDFRAIKQLIETGQVVKNNVLQVAIPTTSGTGSEVTTAAVFIDTEKQVKQAILSPALMPDVAIVDPELTLKLPPNITAATGMDALIHAMEAYTSRKASDITDSFAEKAISLIFKNIRVAYTNGCDIKAREGMSIGSLLAGMAVENAGTTAVHSLAFSLSGKYGVPHGIATSMLTPAVFNFNLTGNEEKFCKIGCLMLNEINRKAEFNAAMVVDLIRDLIKDLELPANFKELKFTVDEEDLRYLSESANLIHRPLENNPRAITVSDIRKIFKTLA